MDRWLIYVPRGKAAPWLDSGSAVVARLDGTDELDIDFEGGRRRQPGMDVFANRVALAVSRAKRRQPTVARVRVAAADWRAVGEWDAEQGEVHFFEAGASRVLSTWLGRELADNDLRATREFL